MEKTINGYTIEVVLDEDPLDPRKDWNLGTLVAWFRHYHLGDKNVPKGTLPKYVNGLASTSDCFYSDSLKHATASLTKAGYLVLPVYMYSHSGVRLSTAPFNDPWDSGQLGLIYTDLNRVQEAGFEGDWGSPAPEGSSCKTLREHITRLLEIEVEAYSSYLSGELYQYTIRDADGDVVDSCGNFESEEAALRSAEPRTSGAPSVRQVERLLTELLNHPELHPDLVDLVQSIKDIV
jgi:hypothetical protein